MHVYELLLSHLRFLLVLAALRRTEVEVFGLLAVSFRRLLVAVNSFVARALHYGWYHDLSVCHTCHNLPSQRNRVGPSPVPTMRRPGPRSAADGRATRPAALRKGVKIRVCVRKIPLMLLHKICCRHLLQTLLGLILVGSIVAQAALVEGSVQSVSDGCFSGHYSICKLSSVKNLECKKFWI